MCLFSAKKMPKFTNNFFYGMTHVTYFVMSIPRAHAVRPMQQRSTFVAAGDPSRAFAALTGNTSDAGIKQVEVVQPTTAISHDYLRHRSEISSPFLSPSTITAETALLAKASIAPKVQHNIAMTKIAKCQTALLTRPGFDNKSTYSLERLRITVVSFDCRYNFRAQNNRIPGLVVALNPWLI